MRALSAFVVFCFFIHAVPIAGAEKRPPLKRSPDSAPFRPEGRASIEALTARALASLVVLRHFDREGKEDGLGTGFVISSNGLVATSLHVIGEARPIRVALPSGTVVAVKRIYAWDRRLDLAILEVNADKLTPLPLGDSDQLNQGANVLALGNPLGLEKSVVEGVVSARREIEGIEMIQVAIPVEPGNSGGPLMDFDGRVQGIITLKAALTRNLGFAMPVNALKSLLATPNSVPMDKWLTIGALKPREWQTLFGARWSQKAGRIEVENPGDGFGGRSLCLSKREVPPRPYELSVEVKLENESGAAGLAFESDGGDKHYGFYPSAGEIRLTRFDGPDVFSWKILKQIPTAAYRPNEWNQFKVRVESERIIGFVNGTQILDLKEDALKNGKVGLAKFRDTVAIFRNFRLGTELPSTESTNVAHLRKALNSAVGSLEDAKPQTLLARATELEKEASSLRKAALAKHRDSIRGEIVETLSKSEDKVDLFRAALLLSKLDNPDLDVGAYIQQFDELAHDLAASVPAKSDDAKKLEILSRFLFTENGFHGSHADYYSPANSYLNQVMDDREGLPITLAVLFIELGKRIGIGELSGVPLPGHFIVKYSNGPKEKLIDVFNGGAILNRKSAAELVEAYTGNRMTDADLEPATKRQIILRMLRNLMTASQRADAKADVLPYLDTILSIAPDSAFDRLSRARSRLLGNDRTGALQDLRWLLDNQPAGVDLERVNELFRAVNSQVN